MKITTDGTHSTTLKLEPDDTSHMHNITLTVLPKILTRFSAKNKQYGENRFDLGMRGQFPEVWRKCSRLRSIIWDGRTDAEEFEDADQVIDDLIGHLLMMKDLLHRNGGMINADESSALPECTDEVLDGEVCFNGQPVSAIDPAAYAVREAKESASYPIDFKGRHSYLVTEQSGDYHFMSAHGKVIPVTFNRERCTVYFEDNAGSEPWQCVGIIGHELLSWRAANGEEHSHPANDGEPSPWGWHINKNLDVWE